jgi:hypothetical protein
MNECRRWEYETLKADLLRKSGVGWLLLFLHREAARDQIVPGEFVLTPVQLRRVDMRDAEHPGFARVQESQFGRGYHSFTK